MTIKCLALCGALPSAPKKGKIFLIEKDHSCLISPHCFAGAICKIIRENSSLQTKKSYGREAD